MSWKHHFCWTASRNLFGWSTAGIPCVARWISGSWSGWQVRRTGQGHCWLEQCRELRQLGLHLGRWALSERANGSPCVRTRWWRRGRWSGICSGPTWCFGASSLLSFQRGRLLILHRVWRFDWLWPRYCRLRWGRAASILLFPRSFILLFDLLYSVDYHCTYYR